MIPGPLFQNTIGGLKIDLVPVRRYPTMKLAGSVQVSDQFRDEFNQWLVDTFGFKDYSALKKGEIAVYEQAGVICIREDDWPIIVAEFKKRGMFAIED